MREGNIGGIRGARLVAGYVASPIDYLIRVTYNVNNAPIMSQLVEVFRCHNMYPLIPFSMHVKMEQTSIRF